jgi:hypothetical protein
MSPLVRKAANTASSALRRCGSRSRTLSKLHKTVILSGAPNKFIHEAALVARSRRACPERSRGNLGGAYLADAVRAFSTTEVGKQIVLVRI